MSKKKVPVDERQMDIFALLKPSGPPQPGSMNISMPLRQSISNAIRKSGKDRVEICMDIYRLTGIEVSKSTQDGWSAESRCFTSDCIDTNGNKRWGIPAEVLTAFCVSTDSWEPLHIVVESGQHKALKGKDVVRARIGLIKEEMTRMQREYKELEKALLQAE